MKNLYLIVGGSGTGKSTIVEAIAKKYNAKIMQSCTDRAPRYEGETGHIFYTKEEFTKHLPMVAYTEFAGHRYGVTADMIDEADLYVIDPAGIIYLYRHYKGNKPIKVIGITADRVILRTRLSNRDGNLNRFIHDEGIFTESVMNLICDKLVDNSEDIEKAIQEFSDIIDEYEK